MVPEWSIAIYSAARTQWFLKPHHHFLSNLTPGLESIYGWQYKSLYLAHRASAPDRAQSTSIGRYRFEANQSIFSHAHLSLQARALQSQAIPARGRALAAALRKLCMLHLPSRETNHRIYRPPTGRKKRPIRRVPCWAVLLGLWCREWEV